MLCKFERSIFQSPEGFCIFGYTTQDPDVPEAAKNTRFYHDEKTHITAVGYHLPPTDAVDVDLTGNWKPSKYGLQLNVERCDQIIPTNAPAIEAYLSSGLITGVGPSMAKAIVARFGDRTMDVLENTPEELLTVKGIARGKLKKIMESYEETKALRDLMTYLAPYGVSPKKAAKILEEFPLNAVQVVQTDPFQLCRIKGFGFLTVDAIARKTRVSLKNPMRYKGAIAYVLDEARTSGHLFLPGAELISQCHDLLNQGFEKEIVTENDIRKAVAEMRGGDIYVEGDRVYLEYERMCEVKVAKQVVTMLMAEGFKPIPNVLDAIRSSERNMGFHLSPSQAKAVEACLTNQISIMTGGPGTGKTSTLKVILDIYCHTFPKNEVLLAAPTGRASRRMTEQTKMPASTLHSALGLITDDDSPMNDTDLLSADLIVVDEVSMVDMRLAYALFDRIKPGAQLIMVGDADQLPSVGAGNVLHELIRCGKIPVAYLDTVFRQASNSRIAINAQTINNNDTHLLFGDDFSLYEVADADEAATLVAKYYLEEVRRLDVDQVQILAPFRKRGKVSVDALNETIQELVNPKKAGTQEVKYGKRVFRVGDRVMQTRNHNGISNGDVGKITDISADEDGETWISITLLDGREIQYNRDMLEDVDLAYAMSIHKSQGGEYPTVILPLLKEHYIMLRRNLLYTAVTRAKAKIIIIGHRQAVYSAIHHSDVDKRNTVLADRINAYYRRACEQTAV